MKKYIILITILNIFLSSALLAQDVNTSRIGKINLSLLAALHPKMAAFDFYRLGFSKAKLNFLFKENYSIDEEKIKNDTKNELDEINKQIKIVQKELSDLCDKEKKTFPTYMTFEGKKEWERIDEELTNLYSKEKILKFSSANPDLTGIKDTQIILENISNEIIEVTKKIGLKNNFDVILNVSMPVPYEYTTRYHKDLMHEKGVGGIDESIYFGILTLKPDFKENTENISYLQNWLSIMNKPWVQDILPIKPYPLVLQGGEDIFPEVFRIICENNHIEKERCEKIISFLFEVGSIEKNEKR